MIQFDFYRNNSMTEFERPDTASTIHLVFASQPSMNLSKYFSKRCLNEV